MQKFLIIFIAFLTFVPVYGVTFINSPFNRNGYAGINSGIYRPTSSYYNTFGSNRYYDNNIHYNLQLPKQNLSALEKYIFNKNYRRDDDISRLERLEEATFGSIQHGDAMTRFKNVENAILSSQNNFSAVDKSILNKLGNYFVGQMTGFTPSILPNNSANYSNRIYQNYNNGIFSNGYRNYDNSYGNGSSIRILD